MEGGIRAVTLDLDDTLWPVLPALERADQDVDAWLREHHPAVAAAWPIAAMRELRARIAAERLDLAHDFTTQRHLTMRYAFAACGLDEAPVEALWEVYFSARNRVELYLDSLPALRRIAARWPVASLTNGNADLERVGIAAHFRHHVSAREVACPSRNRRFSTPPYRSLAWRRTRCCTWVTIRCSTWPARATPGCARPGSIAAAIPGRRSSASRPNWTCRTWPPSPTGSRHSTRRRQASAKARIMSRCPMCPLRTRCVSPMSDDT